MNPEVERAVYCIGVGAFQHIRELLEAFGARNVLVVATDTRYRSTGLDWHLQTIPHRVFSGFTPNPQLRDVVNGCVYRDHMEADCILGIGGGSAMDTAKLIRLLPTDLATAHSIIGGGSTAELPSRKLPLILVPTTAGSGSEATSFATVYSDESKLSLDHPRVTADASIIDANLAASCPREVKAPAMFDALCHAVESYWSLRATEVSLALAISSIREMLGELYENRPPSPNMLIAAHYAGQAINITRTTAAHGFSYAMTSHMGIPHGLACLLNLRWVFAHNLEASQDRSSSVRQRLGELTTMLSLDDDPMSGLARLLQFHGYSAKLSEYGIRSCDLALIAGAGLAGAGRTQNNPVPISLDDAQRWLRKVY
jgi:alcohol dehydrogenase class IV